ncbi:hypothetical protein [Enterococcus sp. AD013-P3]|uniref:hypothetical protein n=1 Tax=Enterococcus sp. AD013-P3 TaxID=3411036 RepID=UPI003B9270F6
MMKQKIMLGSVVVLFLLWYILLQREVISWRLWLLGSGSGLLVLAALIVTRQQYFWASLVGRRDSYTEDEKRLAHFSGWVTGFLGLVLIVLGVVAKS